MEYLSLCVAETEDIGAALAKRLLPGAIVALRGGLGAGKTAFTRGLARGLGISARVTSPTFTIVNEYPGRLPLFHFDLYRLTGEDDLEEIGFSEYLDRGGITVIEWSEFASGALPQGTVTVTLERTGEHSRKIIIEETQ